MYDILIERLSYGARVSESNETRTYMFLVINWIKLSSFEVPFGSLPIILGCFLSICVFHRFAEVHKARYAGDRLLSVDKDTHIGATNVRMSFRERV